MTYNFLKDYNNFEDNVYLAKNNKDFNEKYDNIKKINVNIFATTFKYLSLLGSENLCNKGVGFTSKINKKILRREICNNNEIFKKLFPNIQCNLEDIKIPKFIKYDWNTNKNLITLFNDNDISNVKKISSKYNIALLTESKYVNKNIYNIIHELNKYFNLIITHNKDIIDKYPNKTIFAPGSSSILDWNEMQIFKKTKFISFPTSNKFSGLEGYKLRRQIKDYIESKTFNNMIDTYGTGFNKPFISKSICLKDYKFSICIENTKYDYYVTEKLLDVILSGCIPIYWGMPSIGEIFDLKGMIIFNNIDDLKDIIDNLKEDTYDELLPYVNKNFEIAKKFIDWDDNIVKSVIDKLKIKL